MEYPQKFVADVKELFPDRPKMHELADNGNPFLGRYLDDTTGNVMAIDTILSATSLDDLQRNARQLKRRAGLYTEWSKLFREQHEQI
jgi:hypothetical protein